MKTFKEFDIKRYCRQLVESNGDTYTPNVSMGLKKLREELPQIENVEDFVRYCNECGTRVKQKTVTASSLKPAQEKIDFGKVVDIIQSMVQATPPIMTPIPIDIDGYIIDGHHRWTAIMYMNPAMEIPVYQFNIKLKNLISRKISWYKFDNKLDDLVKLLFSGADGKDLNY